MKDIDKGFKEAIKKLQVLAGKTLQVGILSDAGVNEKTGTLIAEYAYYNEYGTKDIPARSFIRSTCDEQSKKWDAMVDQMKFDPSYSVERLLGTLGTQMAGDIRDKIGSNVPPPLSPATIKRKKSSKTLIDTGVMRKSIKYKIVDK